MKGKPNQQLQDALSDRRAYRALSVQAQAHKRRGRKSIAGLMGRKFLDRLDRGLVMDRTRPGNDGIFRKTIQAPKGLVTMVRPDPLKGPALETGSSSLS
jgi:hypothetical protein